MVNTRRTRSQKTSFTLVELLVAMAIFLVLMVVLATFLSQSSKLWSSNVQQAEEFQSARFAFQGMTQKLSQATLNTYWDYFDANNLSVEAYVAKNGSQNGFTPVTYARQSDLQFTSGRATDLLAGTPYAPDVFTHAVFFQAPLGLTLDTTKRSLVGLLNAVGYFVGFGQLPQPPALVSSAPLYRYALYEFFQPTENLQIYAELYNPFDTTWFTSFFPSPPFSSSPSTNTVFHPIAPNVIALIFRPDDSTNSVYDVNLAPNYFYDSRNGSITAGTGYSSPNTTAATFNQLPPVIHVTMVAIDEASATRLAQQNGTAAPNLLSNSPFSVQTAYAHDLTALTNSLVTDHLNYHIFNADVPIRSAKWSQ